MPKRPAEAGSADEASPKVAKKDVKNPTKGAEKDCAEAPKEKTPQDLYFEKMSAKEAGLGGILGTMMIKGIARDEEEEEEEDGESWPPPTEEELKTLRYVFITENRKERLEEMENYGILEGFRMFKKARSGLYVKAKTPADKLDLLFAYTFHLKEWDVWMMDNEDEKAIASIAKWIGTTWKKLLKNDDKTLGIDAEYTRPGMQQLADDFKNHFIQASTM